MRRKQLPLDSAPEAYRMFRDKQDQCTKVVLKPWDGNGQHNFATGGSSNGTSQSSY
jgi:hypothetical protein